MRHGPQRLYSHPWRVSMRTTLHSHTHTHAERETVSWLGQRLLPLQALLLGTAPVHALRVCLSWTQAATTACSWPPQGVVVSNRCCQRRQPRCGAAAPPPLFARGVRDFGGAAWLSQPRRGPWLCSPADVYLRQSSLRAAGGLAVPGTVVSTCARVRGYCRCMRRTGIGFIA